MAVMLSALRAGRPLPPGFFILKDSWYSFLLEAVIYCYRVSLLYDGTTRRCSRSRYELR
jgi:hypothetical protein